METNAVVLQTRGITAGYGSTTIIDSVDFEARDGEITVIVGPNGSGKSTLLKTIFGLTTIRSGTVWWSGQNIAGMPAHSIARLGIAYLPQVKNIFANLSVDDNLMMAAYTLARPDARQKISDAFVTFADLAKHKSDSASVLSGGQRQMLAMGMALVRRPRVMLFDEPPANLAPKLAEEVLDKIASMRNEFGISIVLVEQNVRRALKIGDAAVVMANGGIVFSGSPDELLAKPELSKLYLGIS